MPTYKITSNIEEIVEAEDEEEAIRKFYEDIENEPQQNISSYLEESLFTTEVCPHCEIELTPRMIDIDGTNLVEHNVCDECHYGYPALL